MSSWVAIDRFAEKERARDAKFRKQNADKVLRSDAKPLTDDELLAKLRSFDIELDRPWLERRCREALSAEEIATPLLEQRTFHGRQGEMESDWIWVCLTTLWQRWFPDQPCFELLDDKIEAGYDLKGSAACRIWLEAWKDVLGLLDKGGLTSIRAFDERFRGSQSLFNWIQDLEDALWNAGLEDRQFLTARIAVCEEGLRRFPTEDELMTENRRARALGESYFELGETGKAESAVPRLVAWPIRAGDGAGSDGRMATDSRAPSYRTGREPNRSCEKGLPSTKSGTASICSNG